jgi:hypothetical protein
MPTPSTVQQKSGNYYQYSMVSQQNMKKTFCSVFFPFEFAMFSQIVFENFKLCYWENQGLAKDDS